MRQVFYILILACYSLMVTAQTALFNNQGADMYVTPGAYMIVKSDSLHNYAGTIQNGGKVVIEGNLQNDAILTGHPTATSGLYQVRGNWINNGTTTPYTDSVWLYGTATQFISGSQPSTFHDLILTGNTGGVKAMTANASVDDVLYLHDQELATQQYEMMVSNPATTAITKGAGASGYVSSTPGGRLSRATNTSNTYLYPVGTPAAIGTFYYRPIAFTPTDVAPNVYSVRLARDPLTDSFYPRHVIDPLCAVNPYYYYHLYHPTGASPTAIRMHYAPADGDYTDIAQWQSSNLWATTATPTAGKALGYATIEIKDWNNFSPEPFALGAKTFTLDAGPDVSIAPGQSTTLTPTIFTSTIDSLGWSPPDGLDLPSVQRAVATPASTTLYTLIVRNGLGCVAHDSVRVTLAPEQLIIPTGFSPNHDGLNDGFRPLNKNLESLTFEIFNRWGEKVFETREIGQGWDGNYKGEAQGIAVFSWSCNYRLHGLPNNYSATGSVTLVR